MNWYPRPIQYLRFLSVRGGAEHLEPVVNRLVRFSTFDLPRLIYLPASFRDPILDNEWDEEVRRDLLQVCKARKVEVAFAEKDWDKIERVPVFDTTFWVDFRRRMKIYNEERD
jgi:hypothetical protein